MRLKEKINHRSHDAKDYVLLTGATGLLGRYLVKDLLLQGHRIALLIRPTKRASARTRMEQILQYWDEQLDLCLPRPVLLEGDVRQPDLGLNEASLAWVTERCCSMIHSAAVLAFYGPSREGEPWVTNVGGTKNVLAFCKEAKIRDLHYVSTAYVCGNRKDLAKETELDVGQDFRNDYERSKFEAEKLVQAASHFDSKTIYRPAVIAGDSESGYTSTYHGLHLYLRLMALMVPTETPDNEGVRHTEIRLPMNGDEPRNIVPVNWVSKTICHLFDAENARGRVFHLVPEQPVTPKLVVDTCYSFFNSTGVSYLGNQEFSIDSNNAFESRFLDAVAMYRDYDRNDPQFCTMQTAKFAGHLICPEITSDTIRKYLEYGEQDLWGKRRVPEPKMEIRAEEFFEMVVQVVTNFLTSSEYNQVMVQRNGKMAHSNRNQSNRDLILGLDVLGPGGGQWHVVASPNGSCTIEPGLPIGQASVLRLEIREFARLFQHPFVERESDSNSRFHFAFASLAQALVVSN